jgi:xylulokinase
VVAGLGLSSKHTRTDLLHAALLGVACAARQALDALVAIQPVAAVGALRLAGGGTVSAPWRQLVPELGATTTPVATRRSGTTVRSLISGGALTNAINGAIAVLDPGS